MTENKITENTSAENVSDNSEAVIPAEEKKRQRRKLHEVTALNDIKYRGPFSYRHFRIFAWITMAMAQAGFFLSIVTEIETELVGQVSWLIRLLSALGGLTLPFFLIASFAVILNAKNGYKKLIILYSLSFLGCIVAFFVVYNHYILGIFHILLQDASEATSYADQILIVVSKNGFIAFNIFVDLLQFTLFTFFINYHPTKRFKGKKIIFFRLFALLPVLYEIFSFTLKMLAATNNIVLSVYVYPILTTKSPTMFILFLGLAFFIKIRERIYRKRNKTLTEYKAFLKTNVNSWHFSVYTSVSIVLSVILDFALWVVVAAFIAVSNGGGQEVMFEAFITANGLGFGDSLGLLIIVPFVLLFSYTKTYKDDTIDKFIPFGGVALIAAVYVEGAFRILQLFA